jgi:hypothetical protein
MRANVVGVLIAVTNEHFSTGRSRLTVLLSFAFSGHLMAQEAPIFPKGKVATVDNHTGTVWLSELSKSDDVFDFNVAHATFAPGAKLD